MTDQSKPEVPAEIPPLTVEQHIESFGQLSDFDLEELHTLESSSDEPRVTLLDAIHRETERRKAEADAKAAGEGFADAASKKAAEEAAAATTPTKRKRKAKAAKGERGFDKGPSAEMRAEIVAEITQAGAAACGAVAIGDDKGPVDEIPAVAVRLTRRRHLVVNADRTVFVTAKVSRTRRYTHAYLLDGSGKKVALATELAAPITISGGEQLVFNAGTLAF